VIRQRGEHGGLGRGQGRVQTGYGGAGLPGVGQDVADQRDELAGAERPGQPAPGADRVTPGAGHLTPGAGRVAPDSQAARPGRLGVGHQEDDRRAQGPADAPGVQTGHGEVEHGRGIWAGGQLG